jgi:hypothetical protein
MGAQNAVNAMRAPSRAHARKTAKTAVPKKSTDPPGTPKAAAKPAKRRKRDAPPREAAMRASRKRGSGAKPLVAPLPKAWRKSWKKPKKRTLKRRQLASLTRAEKSAALKAILKATRDENPIAALKAIEIDNKMQGHNEPERSEVVVTGDFWGFTEGRHEEPGEAGKSQIPEPKSQKNPKSQ